MSEIEHVTGTSFAPADEAQYLKWLDEAAGEQKRLEGRIDRLRDYAKVVAGLIYMATGPQRKAAVDELLERTQEERLRPGDLNEAQAVD